MPQKEKLLEFLSGFISDNKKNLFQNNIEHRTKYMTVVLEDIFQSHNASAVMRSCDCFGVQDIHVIENENEYLINPDVAMGSTKWITLNKYNKEKNNTVDCIRELKKKGYRIVGTTPHSKSCALEDFDITKGKFALLFGSEEPGLSKIAMDECDEFINIPMFGFTESFNISVSAAICLHHLRWKINTSEVPYKLSVSEKTEILLEWTKQVIKKSELLEKEFYKRNDNIVDTE
jgi:tRNA (guanosine-2'-O-)-methyltransferase